MTSSSSDESSRAPENFQISSNDESDENDLISIRTPEENQNKICNISIIYELNLICLSCYKQQQSFNCRNCINNGCITRKNEPYGECLSIRKQKYINVNTGLQTFSQRCEELIKEQRATEDVRIKIRYYQEQVWLLEQLVYRKKKSIRSLSEQLNELIKFNKEKREILPKYSVKVTDLQVYVVDRIEKINKLRERHLYLLKNLKEIVRFNIQQIVEYIFPITEIILKDGYNSTFSHIQNMPIFKNSHDSETIAALADAKNTSYICGKWVFHRNGVNDIHYQIVGPSLPANGDYEAYLNWLKDNKGDIPFTSVNEITPSKVKAFRIIGALTYTTQLTQLISHYLDVRLPFKVGYGDFCMKLNEEEFLHKVSRLNSNIMYLAYTQQVKLTTLNETHTLENMLNILDLDKSDLGHYGYHDVSNAPLIKSVDSVLIGIETATESESEDENSIRMDWESVPNVETPQNDAATSAADHQQAHIAESLIISAASRITSILRWIK